MLQSGAPFVFDCGSYQGLPKVLGTHRPTSSAESSDSPTGLFANSCSGFAQPFNRHVDPAAALIAAAPSADPVQAIRQGLSQLTPAQLAELQAVLRQQRLERQQQDLLPMLSRLPSLASPMYSSPYVAPGSTIDAAPSNSSMLAPMAAAPALPAHNGSTAFGDAAQSALLQSAAAHLLQQLVKNEQLNSAVQLPAAVTPLAMPAAEPRYQHLHHQQQQQVQPQQQWQGAWQWQHPGVTASRSARNTWRRRGNWHTALAALKRKQQQVEAASAADLHRDSVVTGARMGRFAPEVTDALWQQLQQLEQEEQARHKASAQTAQRRSGRARKGKRDWDTTNNASNDVRCSPDPTVTTAAAAAAVAVPSDAAAIAERAGSADSTGANNGSVSILVQHSDLDASKQQQQKRVRFAIADDVDSPQEEQTEEEEELRPKVVRRIGVRAQARKRMHKRTARRRRPMRAPLN